MLYLHLWTHVCQGDFQADGRGAKASCPQYHLTAGGRLIVAVFRFEQEIWACPDWTIGPAG
jgi:hypothetical protein